MTVYLVHLDEPLPRGVAKNGKALQASHYIGYAKDLEARLEEHTYARWMPYDEPFYTGKGKRRLGHTYGEGATFLAVANFRKISWSLARVWPDKDRDFERKLKHHKNAKLLCPVCTANALNHMKG